MKVEKTDDGRHRGRPRRDDLDAREIVRLRDECGWSWGRIAQHLRTAITTIKSRHKAGSLAKMDSTTVPVKNPDGHATGSEPEPLYMRARRRAIERAFHAKVPPTEGASLASYPKRLERQRETARWLWDQEFDYLVTINSNDDSFGYDHGRAALKKFGALVDRELLGKKWSKFPSHERTFFFAVPERAGGELHYHILLKLPARLRGRKPYRGLIPNLTRKLQSKKIFPRGDAHVERLTGQGNEVSDSISQFAAACYVSKELWRPDASNNCVLSSESHTGSH